MRNKIAVIGSGIAGMGCAYHLHPYHDIEIFEQENYFGGHTNTHFVAKGNDQIPIDTGFIVCNYQNYPNLMHLFKTLDVPLYKTSMSFSAAHLVDNIQYCGSSLNLMFAQRKNLLSPRYISFLMQINRFNKQCVEVLDNADLQDLSIAEYLELRKYKKQLLHWYILPMTSALWSSGITEALSFPIAALVRFFKNHGMLGLNTQYQWYTVSGGSEVYKQKLIAPFKHKMQRNAKVTAVSLQGENVILQFSNGETQMFDQVIIATHADQAYSLVKNTPIAKSDLLSRFPYQANTTTLHTDASVMPPLSSIWSSWNYRIENIAGQSHASTTYWMNSLQKISDKQNYFITLNYPGNIDKQHILAQMVYHHPVFTVQSIQAQKQLDVLNTNGKIFFCGSYFGNGFHEDAYVSGLKVAEIITGKQFRL